MPDERKSSKQKKRPVAMTQEEVRQKIESFMLKGIRHVIWVIFLMRSKGRERLEAILEVAKTRKEPKIQ